MINQLQNHSFWSESTDPIWPATAFTIHRNLSHHLFPDKLAPVQREQIATLLKETLLKVEEGSFVDFTEVSGIEREFIYEHFLSGGGFGQPAPGSGAVINKECTFFGQLNVQDHLTFHYVDHGCGWNETWNKLLKIERAVAEQVEYAYSSKFGYLTARPNLCGTGLNVTAFLHLPAIVQTGQLKTALIEDVDDEALPRNLGGEEGEFIGDIVALTNRYAIGIAEDQIMQHLYASANRLMNAEKTLRTHLKEEKNPEMADRMSRALGLLTHSMQLDTKEALNALSLIKLGVNLDWITGAPDSRLNELMFNCRRGHLLTAEGKQLSSEDLLKLRATHLQNALKDVHSTL
jgi:protein arginine kinase